MGQAGRFTDGKGRVLLSVRGNTKEDRIIISDRVTYLIVIFPEERPKNTLSQVLFSLKVKRGASVFSALESRSLNCSSI